jgi:hypothetical protein
MAQTGKEAQATDDGDPEVRKIYFSKVSFTLMFFKKNIIK